jgi:hypothetical protein
LAKKILDDLKKVWFCKSRSIMAFFPSDEERYFKQQGIALGTVNGVYITNVINNAAAEVLKKVILYTV